MVEVESCGYCGSQAMKVTAFDTAGGWLDGAVRYTVSPSCVNVVFCSSCSWARRDNIQ